jgi:hypothetical protein
MIPYFLVTGIIVFLAIAFPRARPHPLAWIAAFLLLVLFTGLRHKVGMDWNNYISIVNSMKQMDFGEALGLAEPSYAALLWASTDLGFGVYGANLVGSIIFCLGLFRFARTTASPWLALAVAMPMLVVVVAMSANRQAIAIGILLWMVATWQTSSLLKRAALILAAASFHFSAVFFLVFLPWEIKMKLGQRVGLGIAAAAAMLGYLQYFGAADYYASLYVSGRDQIIYAPGATQHVLYNGIPALVLFFRRPLRERLLPNALLRQMAWVALVLMPLSFFFSVASSRMTLYLFPVSMSVLAGLPAVLDDVWARAQMRTFIGVLMLGLLAYWLNYANSARAHIPYNNALLMEPSRLAL